MKTKKWIFAFAGFFLLAAVQNLRAAEKEHTFTGFVFRNGNTSNPEISQPFTTPEKCFEWGKGRVWRNSDEYRCGVDCERDATHQMRCYSLGKDGEKIALPSASPSVSPTPSPAGSGNPGSQASPLPPVKKDKKAKARVLVS